MGTSPGSHIWVDEAEIFALFHSKIDINNISEELFYIFLAKNHRIEISNKSNHQIDQRCKD